MGDEFVQILGEGVVVIAGGGLAGFAESAAIVGDDAMAGLKQGRNLLFPGRAAQRISVNQDDRLAGAVIFVIEMDGRGIFFSNFDVGHGEPPLGFRNWINFART